MMGIMLNLFILAINAQHVPMLCEILCKQNVVIDCAKTVMEIFKKNGMLSLDLLLLCCLTIFLEKYFSVI